MTLRTWLKTLICVFCVSWTGTAGAQSDPRIAVLELKGKLTRGHLSVMSDKVRSGVLLAMQGKDYVVMSRENMAVLLKDMGLDCDSVEGECEVETGRNIGAAYVVSGAVEDVGGGLLLVSLKVHDTASGRSRPRVMFEAPRSSSSSTSCQAPWPRSWLGLSGIVL